MPDLWMRCKLPAGPGGARPPNKFILLTNVGKEVFSAGQLPPMLGGAQRSQILDQ